MTTAPAHPPVHVYDGEDPMEIIESKWGRMERWRAQTLSTGEVSALASLSKEVRNDAIARFDAIEERERQLNSREDSIAARERTHAVSVAKFVDFVGQASVLFDKLHKLRADQEQQEQHQHISQLLGDPSETSKEPEPNIATDVGIRDQDEPPAGGVEFPTEPLPHPPVVQQPVAAGLDDDDGD
jgi:hypothetical protein